MSLCSDIATATSALVGDWSCREIPGGRLSVITDRVLSDGDVIELLVSPAGSGWTVSDAGSTVARLTMIDLPLNRESRHRRTGKAIASSYHLRLDEDVLTGEAASVEDLPFVLRAVADAAVALDSVRHWPTKAGQERFSQEVVIGLQTVSDLVVTPRLRVLNRVGTPVTFTAKVENAAHQPFLLQAISTESSDHGLRSAQNAHWLFSGLSDREWPMEQRVAVFGTDPEPGLTERLGEVAIVAPWADQGALQQLLGA